MAGATRGAENAYPSVAADFTSGFYGGFTASGTKIRFAEKKVQLEMGSMKTMSLILDGTFNKDLTIGFSYDSNGQSEKEQKIIKGVPDVIIPADQSGVTFDVTAVHPGQVILGVKSTEAGLQNLEGVFIRIDVVRSSTMIAINALFGWIYIAAWSLSLYPQMYQNWRRKSVVGLNLDFVLYNIIGFICYGLFNVAMFCVPSVLDSYLKIHPRGINPVQLNDVVFSLHAVLITVLTGIQCLKYERGDQKLSKYHTGLMVFTGLFLLVSLVLTMIELITWLTYLYFFSYVKLGATVIKYVPQAYMNYRRKSTEGWSIGSVILHFIGGSFCILQMCFLSYNSDDWGSITGHLSKMAVAVATVLFNGFFMVQHYCLYRNRPDDKAELEQLTSIKTLK